MSDWMIWAVGLVVAAVVVALLVVWLRRRPVVGKSVAVEAADPPAPAVSGPVGAVDQLGQPVVPADQARGYGWMKASDLMGPKSQD